MAESVELFAGRRVAAARSEIGQSQVALAEAVGLERQAVNKAENAVGSITVSRLCQYALALGVEPADLLPRLDELPELIGMGGITTLERVEAPNGEAYVEAVVTGARQYIEDHGARPRIDGGDASSYVGFNTTWSAIDCALKKGSNGAPACGGIHYLLDARGVGKRRRRR